MLLFVAKSMSKRTDSKVSVTNIAGIKTIKLQKSSLKTEKNPYLLENKEYYDKLKIERNIKMMDFQSLHSKLVKRQKCICTICEEIFELNDQLEVDHIIPVSKGGTNELKNLRLLHKECHRNIVHGSKKE